MNHQDRSHIAHATTFVKLPFNKITIYPTFFFIMKSHTLIQSTITIACICLAQTILTYMSGLESQVKLT